MGSILALLVLSLSIAPTDLVWLRWIVCGMGLLLIMLLITGWGGPHRRKHELLKQARRAEATREETERFFVALMDSVPSNIYFKNLESKFVRVNQSMAQWVKAGHPHDLIGKTDSDLFKSEHTEQARADELQIIKTGKRIEGYIEKETFPDGSRGWVLSAKLPFRDRNGNLIG